MSDKIVLEVGRYHNLVFGRVLEMPERLRSTGRIAIVDGFELSSNIVPELDRHKDHLYLRGSNEECDGHAFCRCFSSSVRAEEIVEMIRAAVVKANAELVEEPAETKPIRLKTIQ